MNQIIEALKLQTKNGNLSHAYLVLGELPVTDLAAVLEIQIPDRFILNESPIKIESLREMLRWLYLKPHSSKTKAAFIFEADSMTLESANAILKAIEEPPENSIIFLQATKKDRILPTILSRCQIFKSKLVTAVLSEKYLSPEEIGNKSVKEKFVYAGELAVSPDLKNILDLWEQYFRQRLLRGSDERENLNEINRVRSLLSSNSSIKLLLENLFLNFS